MKSKADAFRCLLLFALLLSATAATVAQDAAPPDQANDAQARAAILDSPEWRRAMFEVNEWFRTQQVYTPAQVEEVRLAFQQRMADASAAELKLVLADLQAKLALMDSPQAREARAWMAEYVAVMSNRKREQVLSQLPNLGTLTSQQLHDELVRIQNKRADLEQRQAAFGGRQAGKVAARSQQLAASQAAANRPRPAASHSPYRPASNVNDRLNTTPINNRPTFFVNPLGGLGRTLPGAW
jgi:hypothetical protein